MPGSKDICSPGVSCPLHEPPSLNLTIFHHVLRPDTEGEWGGVGVRILGKVGARRVGRQQSAGLAAILPAPRRRRPERMGKYSGVIIGEDPADRMVVGEAG